MAAEGDRMTRILITGWPRAGKTTLSTELETELGIAVRHTDDLIGSLDWSAASAEVALWLAEPGPWIIEGVSIARALRKYREAHPGEPPPCERLICLRSPYVVLTGRQEGMGRGVDTVMRELEPWLVAHGLDVEQL